MKYIANRDLKKLKELLDGVFRINISIDLLRVYATDLGMEQFTQDCYHLAHYKQILAGLEEYEPYELEAENEEDKSKSKKREKEHS